MIDTALARVLVKPSLDQESFEAKYYKLIRDIVSLLIHVNTSDPSYEGNHEAQLYRAHELQMQAISLVQLFELPQRELFERKDQV